MIPHRITSTQNTQSEHGTTDLYDDRQNVTTKHDCYPSQHTAQQDFVKKIALAVNKTLDITNICEAFYKAASEHIPIDRIAIWLKIANSDRFRMAAMYGMHVPAYQMGDVLTSESLLGYVERCGTWMSTILASDDWEYQDVKIMYDAGIRSVAAIPLYSGIGVNGVLVVSSIQATAYSGFHMELIEEAALYLTSAVCNSELFTQVERAKCEWQKTFDSVTDGITVISSDRYILRANQPMLDLLDKDRSEVIGGICYKLLFGNTQPCAGCPFDAPSHQKNICNAMSASHPNHLLSLHPMFDTAGKVEAYVHIFRDVTSERQTEQYLSRSNRLLAIGELAAGVAHNFGNVLMSFSATLELLQMRAMAEPALKDLTGIIDGALDQVTHGADVIQRLLSLARGTPSNIGDVHPEQVARNAIALCATHPLAKRLHLLNEITDDAPYVKADAGQLEEVVVNLLLNALQSTDEGSIRIGVEYCVENGLVEIFVADDGCGISPEDIGRVFDPFYSKRRDGAVGTGLGLSCSLAQVNRMGGTLGVESELGKGSTFKIRLPASDNHS